MAVGHVDDDAIIDVIRRKLRHVMAHEPICGRCPYDPVNRLADALRAADDGARVADGLAAEGASVLGILAAMEPVALPG